MPQPNSQSIIFDFSRLKGPKADKIVANISAIAVAGDHVWTASDERRTLQCFKWNGSTFVLKDSLDLDEVIDDDLPDRSKEADLEALAFDGKFLWFCGSHCVARPRPEQDQVPVDDVDETSSRSVLGRLKLASDGSWSGRPKGRILSTLGEGALRNKLRKDRMLSRFLDIPAKENGLDIEGMACMPGRRLVLGLRGPVISARAILLELQIDGDLKLLDVKRHFLNLDGLGVRDLYSDGSRLLILAGPTFPTDKPFRIYAVTGDGKPQDLKIRLPSGPDDHPEAITLFPWRGRQGLLMLADGKTRAGNDLRYRADWYPLPS